MPTRIGALSQGRSIDETGADREPRRPGSRAWRILFPLDGLGHGQYHKTSAATRQNLASETTTDPAKCQLQRPPVAGPNAPVSVEQQAFPWGTRGSHDACCRIIPVTSAEDTPKYQEMRRCGTADSGGASVFGPRAVVGDREPPITHCPYLWRSTSHTWKHVDVKLDLPSDRVKRLHQRLCSYHRFLAAVAGLPVGGAASDERDVDEAASARRRVVPESRHELLTGP